MVRVALAALILTSPAWSAIVRVQHVSNGGSGISALSATVTATTIGNLIVACASNTNTPTTMTFSDNGSNSYTPVTGSPLASTIACSWSLTTASTTSVTITCNASGAITMEAIEYSGIKSPGPFDSAGNGTGTSATWTSSFTPAGGSEVIVGFVHTATTGSYSASSGFSIVDSRNNSFDSISTQDQITSPSGAVTFTGSTPGAASVAWQTFVFAFFGSSGGATGSIQVTQR